MQRLYIDANASIGRAAARDPETPWKAESLLDDMEYCRIHGALVCGRIARDYSFVAGNREVAAVTGAHPRLFGAAVVAPGLKFELDEGEGYFDALADAGVRAFRVFPELCGHEFTPFEMEGVASFLIRRGMPLVTDLPPNGHEGLRQVLQAFPELNVLLCGAHWSGNRSLFPLLERYPNLYFEFSANQANSLLDVCKRHFGADRVLFGTDWPHKSPGALKALVEYSGLAEEDKDLVASGNAVRLFRIEPHCLALYDESRCKLDSVARRADRGERLSGELVLDAHAHMVDREDRIVCAPPMYGCDDDGIVRSMDALGVHSALVSPWEGIMVAERGNETVLQASRRYPGRILCYATWNPNYPEDLDRVINVYHGKHRFPGIKPYAGRHGTDVLDERYRPWFEYGDRNSLILLVHVDCPDVADKAAKVAEMYPHMAVLLAHAGQSWPVARRAAALARNHENVYAEITFTALTHGSIEYLVREAGANKVLYGSDMPMRDAAPQLAWVCYARISEEDKRRILGGNIKKLLDRCYNS